MTKKIKSVKKLIKKTKVSNTNYAMLVFWSDEDNCWVVGHPEFKGCMAHGDTVRTAINRAIEAKDFMLECMKEDGEEPPPRVIVDYESFIGLMVRALEVTDRESPPVWRPIATAPKDGTSIIAVDRNTYVVLYWNGKHWQERYDFGVARSIYPRYPKHWIPIPVFPDSKA
jgi:predicted RNase H-like HicB family nuclease